MTDQTLTLLEDLIRCQSITPHDAGCQQILAERLAALGFACEHLPFGQVSNLWACHGAGGPTVVFAGHTDVVPPGPESAWHGPPFAPRRDQAFLYGRGAADMKGALAAMLGAVTQFCTAFPEHPGALAMLLTSDEEGDAIDGTKRVMDTLYERGQAIDYCLIGEPSSSTSLGDCIRVGRRGSLNGKLLVRGIQGHTAYPEKARNPIHELAPALHDLAREIWDAGTADFPATSFQISSIHAGDATTSNVTPGELTLHFNFRFAPCSTAHGLLDRVREILAAHGLDYTLDSRLSGPPFATAGAQFTDLVSRAVQAETGTPPRTDTGGGTSDGRFIAASGAQIVELGLVNASIHQANEHVRIADIAALERIYFRLLKNLLIGQE